MDNSHFQTLFQKHNDFIIRVANSFCRRQGFSREESEDFLSSLTVKLLDQDYAVFRKFKGDSQFTTYLTTVIRNFLQEYRIKLWGKWRPSARARELGSVAIQLERLTVRDGISFVSAVAILQTNHGVELSERELAGLFAQLPLRFSPRQVDEEILQTQPGREADGETLLLEAESDRQRERAGAMIQQLFQGLDSEEQLILRWVYLENFKVSDVARRFGFDQKRLYRRIDKLKARLREAMERSAMP